MTRASEIAEIVLDELNAAESGAFAGVRYREEPILYTGAQAPGRMPDRIRKMHKIAEAYPWRTASFGWYGVTSQEAKLFYEQARFMEDFEDDCPYKAESPLYFPTYEDMPDRMLRGYFTWRARWRAGKPEEAPLTYLFVHAYELLCGVGAQPGMQGYRALELLRRTYAGTAQSFDDRMREWRRDYVVYHGLDPCLMYWEDDAPMPPAPPADPFARGVMTLRRAQAALVASDGAAEPVRDDGVPPDPSQVFGALAATSRYRIDRSAALRAHREDMENACYEAFSRMVDHCRRRRKEGFVEGMFGYPCERRYRMFESAVFYEEAPRADCDYPLPAGEGYYCRGGSWFHRYPASRRAKSKELGRLLRAVDCELRALVGDVPPLKEHAAPAYVAKIARESVQDTVGRRLAEEAARVVIDRKALSGIRAAAAVTRESLLVDEEREGAGDVPAAAPAPVRPDARVAAEPPRREEGADAAGPGRGDGRDALSPGAPAPPHGGTAAQAAPPLGLTARQAAFLRMLVSGGLDEAALGPGPSIDMEADAVNEAFMEELGDVVVEFDGAAPRIVEDYLQDVKEALA